MVGNNAPKRPWRRMSLFALGLVVLAGCAGRPHGVLVPTHVRPSDADLVSMFVVTTRAPDAQEPGAMFSGERSFEPSFADITVSIPRTRTIGEVQWPAQQLADPSREFTTVEARVLTKDQALAAFDGRIKKTPKRQALLFIHGFNTKFEEAVYRFAQIAHDSDADIVPVLFTWPSRGNVFQYGYDHESASFSRDSLETTLQTLARDPNVGEISILAHSMGNWVTLEALRQMSIRNKGLSLKIRNIMLAAPDVDFDVFRRQIRAMNARPGLFTVFVSRDDEALAVSRRVWGNKPRLGAVDATTEPYRDDIENEGITVVDLTDVNSPDRINHGKFAQSPEVVRSIGARLAAGQALNDGRAGVGQKLGIATAGAVSSVGAAAGVAVSAPFAIVDPRTREGFGDHVQSIGEPLDAAAHHLGAH
jgi:esterase/lipase superfamily enzyme